MSFIGKGHYTVGVGDKGNNWGRSWGLQGQWAHMHGNKKYTQVIGGGYSLDSNGSG
jgi:hypothetical protein